MHIEDLMLKVSEKFMERFYSEKISKEKADILILMSEDDETLTVEKADQLPFDVMRVDNTWLFDPASGPEIAAKYKKALVSLLYENYLEAVSQNNYQLTISGWRKANTLKEKYIMCKMKKKW